MEERQKIEVPDGMEWCRKWRGQATDCFNKHMVVDDLDYRCHCKVCHCAFSLEWREERDDYLGILPRRILILRNGYKNTSGRGKRMPFMDRLSSSNWLVVTLLYTPTPYVHRIL